MGKEPERIVIVLEDPPRGGLPWRWIAPFAALAIVLAALWVGAMSAEAPGAARASQAARSQAVPTATPAASPSDDPDRIIAAGQDALNALEARMNEIDVSCSTLSGKAYNDCTATFDALDEAWNRLSDCIDKATTLAAEGACESAVPAKP